MDFLKEFYVDQVVKFDEAVGQRLTTINHRRWSFCRPERSVHLDDVHPFVFVEPFGKKMLDEEILPKPPCEKLPYGILSMVGVGRR